MRKIEELALKLEVLKDETKIAALIEEIEKLWDDMAEDPAISEYLNPEDFEIFKLTDDKELKYVPKPVIPELPPVIDRVIFYQLYKFLSLFEFEIESQQHIGNNTQTDSDEDDEDEDEDEDDNSNNNENSDVNKKPGLFENFLNMLQAIKLRKRFSQRVLELDAMVSMHNEAVKNFSSDNEERKKYISKLRSALRKDKVLVKYLRTICEARKNSSAEPIMITDVGKSHINPRVVDFIIPVLLKGVVVKGVKTMNFMTATISPDIIKKEKINESLLPKVKMKIVDHSASADGNFAISIEYDGPEQKFANNTSLVGGTEITTIEFVDPNSQSIEIYNAKGSVIDSIVRDNSTYTQQVASAAKRLSVGNIEVYPSDIIDAFEQILVHSEKFHVAKELANAIKNAQINERINSNLSSEILISVLRGIFSSFTDVKSEVLEAIFYALSQGMIKNYSSLRALIGAYIFNQDLVLDYLAKKPEDRETLENFNINIFAKVKENKNANSSNRISLGTVRDINGAILLSAVTGRSYRVGEIIGPEVLLDVFSKHYLAKMILRIDKLKEQKADLGVGMLEIQEQRMQKGILALQIEKAINQQYLDEVTKIKDGLATNAELKKEIEESAENLVNSIVASATAALKPSPVTEDMRNRLAQPDSTTTAEDAAVNNRRGIGNLRG